MGTEIVTSRLREIDIPMRHIDYVEQVLLEDAGYEKRVLRSGAPDKYGFSLGISLEKFNLLPAVVRIGNTAIMLSFTDLKQYRVVDIALFDDTSEVIDGVWQARGHYESTKHARRLN